MDSFLKASISPHNWDGELTKNGHLKRLNSIEKDAKLVFMSRFLFCKADAVDKVRSSD